MLSWKKKSFFKNGFISGLITKKHSFLNSIVIEVNWCFKKNNGKFTSNQFFVSVSPLDTKELLSLPPSETTTTSATTTNEDMVSRRKILSRSRDNLNLDAFVKEEEDVWYQKEKLFRVRTEYIWPHTLFRNMLILHTKNGNRK